MSMALRSHLCVPRIGPGKISRRTQLSKTGAAIGAGTGLVAGSAVGSGNARAAGGSLQARYDTVYAQCMSAKGNRIPAPPVVGPVYVYPHPYY